MPLYDYTAVDARGERGTGTIQADDQENATQKLLADYAAIVSLRPARSERAGEASGFRKRVSEAFRVLRTHVPMANVVFFTRQLATMFAAGMHVERSLKILGNNERHKGFKEIIEQICSDVQAGRSLSAAMSVHPGAFSRLFVAMVRAGEISGNLDEILERLAEYQERSEDVRRKVVSALYYPAFVLTILVVAVLLLLVFVAPRFGSVYESFGANLPLPTQILMDVSNFMATHLFTSFVSFLLIGAGMIMLGMTEQGRRAIDFCKLRAPVLGILLRDSIHARFARTLGLLLGTNVEVLEAFTLVSRVLSNVIMEKAVLVSRDLVEQGRKIHAALGQTRAFPDLVTQLVATGEETGKLDELLLRIAEHYEKQVDAFVRRLTSLLEPMLIMLLGVVVGGLVIVIYLPIFYLGSAMKKGMG